MEKIMSKFKIFMSISKFTKIQSVFSDLKADYPLYEPSKVLNDSHFVNSFPTMMFLDGFRDKVDETGRRWMVDAFLSRGGYNVINVNWDKIAGGNYVFNAFPNSIKVSF